LAVEQLRYNGNADATGVRAANLVAAFYERREFRPAWRDEARIDGLLRLVDDAYADGLEPRDYHRDAILEHRRKQHGAAEPAEAAAFELLLTDALVSLVHHPRPGQDRKRAAEGKSG